MKKWLKWLLITIGVALVALFIYFIVKQSLREEAVLTFPDTILVENTTDLDVERTAKALTHYVFGYDTMNIMFVKMPKHLETFDNIDILAFIMKNQFKQSNYIIYLSSKVTSSNLKKVLSHEFVHIKQMEDKQLIQFPPEVAIAIWEGDTVDYHIVPYENRPHEIDAHAQDGKIYNQLDDVLYE